MSTTFPKFEKKISNSSSEVWIKRREDPLEKQKTYTTENWMVDLIFDLFNILTWLRIWTTYPPFKIINIFKGPYQDFCFSFCLCFRTRKARTKRKCAELCSHFSFLHKEYLTHTVRVNTKIIDNDDNWNLLLYKEANHIKRSAPSLNNGLKASRELCLFSWHLRLVLYFHVHVLNC